MEYINERECDNAQTLMHFCFITESRNSLESLPYGITNDRNLGLNQPFRFPTDALLLTPPYIHMATVQADSRNYHI
jgi:hypothetical protein